MANQYAVSIIRSSISRTDRWEDDVTEGELELKRLVEMDDSILTVGGSTISKGLVFQEEAIEVATFRGGQGSEVTTKNTFALRLDGNHGIEMIENEAIGEREEEEDPEFERELHKQVNRAPFWMVDDDLIVLSNSDSVDTTLETLEDAFSCEIERVNFDVRCILESFGQSEITHGQWEDVDEFTTSATISGNIDSSEITENMAQSGRLTWVIVAIEEENKRVKLGISSSGQIVVYSPYNLPIEDVVRIIIDDIEPCITY